MLRKGRYVHTGVCEYWVYTDVTIPYFLYAVQLAVQMNTHLYTTYAICKNFARNSDNYFNMVINYMATALWP